MWMVRVNSIESSSAMSIGTNLLLGWGSNTKAFNGNAEMNGDQGQAPTSSAGIDDRDVLDQPWSLAPQSTLGTLEGLPMGVAPCCTPPTALWQPGGPPCPAPPLPAVPLWPPPYC
jgi:hypothetical protein